MYRPSPRVQRGGRVCPMEPKPPPETPAKPHVGLDVSRSDPKSPERWDASLSHSGNGETRGAGSSVPAPLSLRGVGKKRGSRFLPRVPDFSGCAVEERRNPGVDLTVFLAILLESFGVSEAPAEL